jgi:hypothetical protein
MKTNIALFLAAFANCYNEELSMTENFALFTSKHNKVYEGVGEYQKRHQIYEETMNFV